jgi:hypothetical protein
MKFLIVSWVNRSRLAHWTSGILAITAVAGIASISQAALPNDIDEASIRILLTRLS